MRAFVVLFQLFLLVESSESIRLPDLPWNLAVTVGQKVGMKCKLDNISRVSEWTFQRPLSHNKRSIWTNWKGETKIRNATFDFDVDEDGSVTFNTNSIRLEDAGIYTCVVDKAPRQPERYSAQLIVFESDPQCDNNISAADGSIKEFDYIAFRCAVNYSGHWTPSMQWSIDGNALNETHRPTVANKNISQDVQQLTSVISLQVNAEDNDMLITCKTFFIETTDKTNATNVPEYLFYWNTTLHVLYGPRNVTITPKKDKYQKKDVLSCNAVGKPSPSYTWRNVRTQETIADGPQLVLNEAGLEANGRHIIECIAQNQVSDHIKQSSATIDIIIQGTSILWLGLIGAAGVGMVLPVLAVVIFQYNIKKSKTQSNLTNEDPPRKVSSYYESIHETEIDVQPSTSTTVDAAAPKEDVSEGYSALTERPVIVHGPPVYCSLDVSSIIQDEASEMTPVYANIVPH